MDGTFLVFLFQFDNHVAIVHGSILEQSLAVGCILDCLGGLGCIFVFPCIGFR